MKKPQCPICNAGVQSETQILVPVYDPSNLIHPIGFYKLKKDGKLHNQLKEKGGYKTTKEN